MSFETVRCLTKVGGNFKKDITGTNESELALQNCNI